MPKRSSKPSADPNVAAFKAVTRLAGSNAPAPQPPKKRKNPAAVALGRLGGLKGGKARANKLSSTERSDIARLAAQSRWKKTP